MLRRHAAMASDDPGRAILRNRIVESNLPLSRRLARRYAGRGEPYDDLTQVAALALIKAVDGFDTGRDVPFSGYATPTILGALRRHFRDTTWAIRVPRQAQELNGRMRTASMELAQREGREPTPTELAGHLGVSVDAVLAGLIASQAYRLTSLNAPHRGTGSAELVEYIGAVDPGYGRTDDHLALISLLAALPPREHWILMMSFHQHMTQSRIAAEIGVSQMHVSRLIKRSLAQLRIGMSDRPPASPEGSARPGS